MKIFLVWLECLPQKPHSAPLIMVAMVETSQRRLYPEVFVRGGSFKTRGGSVFVARTTRNDKNSPSPPTALWEYPNSVLRDRTITWTNIRGFGAVRLNRRGFFFRFIRGVNDESSSSRPTGTDRAVSDGAVWPQVQRRRVSFQISSKTHSF